MSSWATASIQARHSSFCPTMYAWARSPGSMPRRTTVVANPIASGGTPVSSGSS